MRFWKRLLKTYHEGQYARSLLRAEYHRRRMLDLQHGELADQKRAERIHNELRRMCSELDAKDALLEGESRPLWN